MATDLDRSATEPSTPRYARTVSLATPAARLPTDYLKRLADVLARMATREAMALPWNIAVSSSSASARAMR